MATAIRIWRVLLWILGAVFVLPSAFLLWTSIRYSLWQYDRFTAALFGLYFLASVLGLVGAFGMKRAKRWARPMSWIAASLQTLAIPLFTPLGIFGLILLSRGAGRPGTPPARVRRSQRTGIAGLIVIELFVIFLAVDGFFRWSRRLGYPETHSLRIALPILWACTFLQLVIHEAGHALAVKFVRGHIHRFQIGPLRWRRESGRTWMEFARKFSSGSVTWTPGMAGQLTRQRLLVTAGGPFANLGAPVNWRILWNERSPPCELPVQHVAERA
jgi:hypothetical protein